MHTQLAELAGRIRLQAPEHGGLRAAFALACIRRIEHLLEDERTKPGVEALRAHAAGELGLPALQACAGDLQRIANAHRGSHSIDGSQHAAVSATYALANALADKPLEAASYAAYAAVYAYGGYAVTDRESFEPEFAWQLAQLRQLAQAHGVSAGGA